VESNYRTTNDTITRMTAEGAQPRVHTVKRFSKEEVREGESEREKGERGKSTST